MVYGLYRRLGFTCQLAPGFTSGRFFKRAGVRVWSGDRRAVGVGAGRWGWESRYHGEK